MNILNAQQSKQLTQDKTLSDIDKKIIIKQYKEKNKNKTCINGLFDFVSEKDMQDLVKSLKKKLGCSGTIFEDPETKIKKIVFSGNHFEEIKELLIEKKITDANHIR